MPTKSRTPWWQSLYLDPELTAVIFGWQNNKTQDEIQTILSAVKPAPGARILDLACGQGRHCRELALHGYKVTGLDYSTLYEKQFRSLARALPRPLRPEFVLADMRSYKREIPAQSFDLVLNLWNAFGYFDKRSDDLRVIREIARVLKPGGKLIINTLNEPGVRKVFAAGPRQHWLELSRGRFFLDQASYDSVKKRITARWILIDPKKGVSKRFDFGQNVYSPQDFGREFAKVGMRVIGKWGMLGGEPYTPSSWHQTLVVEKR